MWQFQIGIVILFIFASLYFLLSNQIHSGIVIFGIGLIFIAFTLINPFSRIRAMKQASTIQEIEEIELVHEE